MPIRSCFQFMEESNVRRENPKPYLSQMNPNMELFTNLSSMEGFNPTLHTIMPLSNQGFPDHHQTHLPMPFNDVVPRSNGPIFDPMAHFFDNMPEILVNTSSPSVSGTGPKKGDKKHQEQVWI